MAALPFLQVSGGPRLAPVAAVEASGAAQSYSVSGTVVSARDGAPVVNCRMQAIFLPALQITGGATPAGETARPVAPADARPSARRPPGRFPLGSRAAAGNRSGPEDNVTFTDAHGHFQLNLPKAGAWRVTGTARGYNSQALDEHEGYSSAVVLTESAPAMDVTFRLRPDAIVSGNVTDEAGEPVTNAQVTALAVERGAPGGSQEPQPNRAVQFAQTDDRGHYELAGLPPGPYVVKLVARPWYARQTDGSGPIFLRNQATPPAQSQGWPAALDPSLDVVYAPVWFPGAAEEDAAETLELKGGEEREADFHLTPIPAIHLHVPRAIVSDPSRSSGERTPFLVQIDNNAGIAGASSISVVGDEWVFGGLAPGTYQLQMPGSGGEPGEDLRQIEVRPGANGELTLEAARSLVKVTFTVEGATPGEVNGLMLTDVVTGRQANSSMNLNGRGPRRFGGSAVRPENSADVSPEISVSVPPGRYRVGLAGSADLYPTGLRLTASSPAATPSGTAAGPVAGLEIVVGGAPLELTVQVGRGRAEINGFVRRQAAPVAGAMVLLVPALLGQPGNAAIVERDQTNTDGSYQITGIVPGKYLLVAIDRGWETNWHDPATLNRYLLQGVALELGPQKRVRRDLPAVSP